jgi:hypothetical protein
MRRAAPASDRPTTLRRFRTHENASFDFSETERQVRELLPPGGGA